MEREIGSHVETSAAHVSVGGECLCGAVQFTIEPPYRWFAHCHCSMCRKHHGSLFGTGLGVARESLRFLHGVEEIVHYRASPAFERPFCRRCGSTVPGVSHDDSFFHVPAGLLRDDPGARPRSHIFVGSRSPLAVLDSTLPRYDAYPPGMDLPVVANPTRHRTNAPVRGGCLCGAVVFEVSGTPERVVHCHCSLCRRSHAAAFSSTVIVPSAELRFVRGAACVRPYALPAPRHGATAFCGDCGSLVPVLAQHSPAVRVPAGGIDTPLAPLPAVHVHVGSKAPWDEIVDEWPQLLGAPDAG